MSVRAEEDIIRKNTTECIIDEENFHHCDLEHYKEYIKYMNTAQLWKELYRKEHQMWKTRQTYKKIHLLKEKIDEQELEHFLQKHAQYTLSALKEELEKLEHKFIKTRLEKKEIPLLRTLIEHYDEHEHNKYHNFYTELNKDNSVPIII